MSKLKIAPKPEAAHAPPDHIREALEGIVAGGRVVKVYAAPKGVRDFLAVAMRDATNDDSLDAAELADAMLTDAQRESIRTVIQRERWEAAKLTVVAICDGNGWRMVDHSTPYLEPDDWSQKGGAALSYWYQDLNGIDDDDAKKSLEEAVVIGQPAPRASGAADVRSAEKQR